MFGCLFKKLMLNARYGKYSNFIAGCQGGLHIVLSPRKYGYRYEITRRKIKQMLINAYNGINERKAKNAIVIFSHDELVFLLKELEK